MGRLKTNLSGRRHDRHGFRGGKTLAIAKRKKKGGVPPGGVPSYKRMGGSPPEKERNAKQSTSVDLFATGRREEKLQRSLENKGK